MKIGSHFRCDVFCNRTIITGTTVAQVINLSVAPMTRKDEAESTLDLCIDELIEVAHEGARVRPHYFERRGKPRLKKPFAATVWGVDSGDLPFNIDCVLGNISSTGLYLRIPKWIEARSEVRLIVHLLNGATTGATAAVQGCILRSELADGKHGLAIAIKKHRFP